MGIMGWDEGVPLGTGTILNVTGDGATLTISGAVLNLNIPGGGVGGGGAFGVMVQDEGVPLGTGTTLNFVGSGVTATISGSVVQVNISGTGGGGSTNHPYYQKLAASLEPDAIYPLFSDAFDYTVTGTNPQMILASYYTRMSNAGRMEIRDPHSFYMLASGTNVNGIASTASMVLLNPSLPVYSDAYTKYYDRLESLSTMKQRKIDITDPAVSYPFLLGAYGGIVTRVVNFDYDWIIVGNRNSVNNLNLANEINDGASAAQRNDSSLTLALNKYVATELRAGAERSAGVGQGTVVFSLCPSDWSVIPDPTSYVFRDDFMGVSLVPKWAVTGSALQINQIYQWASVSGTVTWGANGAYSNTSVSRSSGTVFQVDIYTGRNATANNSHMFGWSDGLGHSYTNFSHGILFTSSGAADIIKVYENGNDRGQVGTHATGTIYRVKITITGNNAKYEIQGGAYGAIGGANWSNITPGTTSSSTTPLQAGFSVGAVGTMYISDARIY